MKNDVVNYITSYTDKNGIKHICNAQYNRITMEVTYPSDLYKKNS
jgi:hypothetical protein